jgi:tetratricopeptide (TPR) repeat protein
VEGDAFHRTASLLEEALAADPDFLMAQITLAWLHVRSCFLGMHPDPDCEERAREAVERAMEIDSTSADARFVLGDYLYRIEGDYEGALDALDPAAGVLRWNGDYQRTRAYIQRMAGRWEAAVTTLRDQAQHDPTDVGAPTQLGLCLLYLRRFQEADSALRSVDERLTRWWPSDGYTEHRLNLGRMERMRGETGPFREWAAEEGEYAGWQLAMAREDWPAALEANSRMTGPLANVIAYHPVPLLTGWAHQAAGDTEAAQEDLRAATRALEAMLAEDPDDTRYHESLGLAYAGLGLADEAVREGERAVELQPPDRNHLHGPYRVYALAAIRAQVGDTEGALTELDRVMGMPSLFTSEWVENDFLFASIRDDPRFKELMKKHRGQVF